MRLLLGLMAATVHAQTSMPVGIVRGDMVSWNGTSTAGELRIRNPDNIIYACLYDARTYFERDHQRIGVAGLAAGDPVEILSDRKPGLMTCYARTVHIVEAHAQRLTPGMRPRLRSAYSPTELFAPRGNMTVAGVVIRSGNESLTVRTRTGDQILLLRADTRYLGEGVRMDSSVPLVNKHVFIRCGKNLDGDVEAYQVVWGEILSTR